MQKSRHVLKSLSLCNKVLSYLIPLPPFSLSLSCFFRFSSFDVHLSFRWTSTSHFSVADNSSCSSPDSSWEGVGVEGACFKWSLYDVNGMAALATCKGLSPAHLPASVHTEQELAMLGTLYDSEQPGHLLPVVLAAILPS